jgi:hypothetical protein
LFKKEVKQSVIAPEEDDPDAVEEVLRKVYGCTLPAASTREWRFWFNLVIAADKYFEPALGSNADKNLREVALEVQDADVIFDIDQAIKTDMSHLESLLKFAEVLRKKHLKKLLKNGRYRDLLVGDQSLMLAQLDELERGLEVVPTDAYALCAKHAGEVFKPHATHTDTTACTLCPVVPFTLDQQGPPLLRGLAAVPSIEHFTL